MNHFLSSLPPILIGIICIYLGVFFMGALVTLFLLARGVYLETKDDIARRKK